MALTPIDLFQPQGSIVGRMLAGGTNVFADAIQSTVRAAAGLSDNQVRQERDFLSERRNQDELANRRAENIQQQMNADRLFAFNAATDARDFGFKTEQATLADADRDRAFKRNVDQDAFSRKAREQELGMSKDRLKLSQDKFDLEKDDLERDRAFDEFLMNPVVGPQPATGDPTSPEVLFAEAEVQSNAAKERRNGPAYLEAERKKAEAQAAMRRGTSSDGTRDLTPSEKLALEKDGRAKLKAEEDARQKEIEQLVTGDVEAFPRHQSMFQTKINEQNTIVPVVDSQMADYTAAGERDKNVVQAETLAAKDASSAEEFILMTVPTRDPQDKPYTEEERKKLAQALPEKVRKRRARLWELVNRGAPAAASSEASDPDPAAYVRGFKKLTETK